MTSYQDLAYDAIGKGYAACAFTDGSYVLCACYETSRKQCACPRAASLQEFKALVKSAPNRYTDL